MGETIGFRTNTHAKIVAIRVKTIFLMFPGIFL